jgi:hypothetical protein
MQKIARCIRSWNVASRQGLVVSGSEVIRGSKLQLNFEFINFIFVQGLFQELPIFLLMTLATQPHQLSPCPRLWLLFSTDTGEFGRPCGNQTVNAMHPLRPPIPDLWLAPTPHRRFCELGCSSVPRILGFFSTTAGIFSKFASLYVSLRASTNDKSNKKTQPKIIEKELKELPKRTTAPYLPRRPLPTHPHYHIVTPSASKHAQLKGSISFPTVPDGTIRTAELTTRQAGPGLVAPNRLASHYVLRSLLHR